MKRLLPFSVAAIVLASSAIVGAAPAYLVKDIHSGFWPLDQRTITRVDATTDAVYMLSIKSDNGGNQKLLINSSNTRDPESHIGWTIADLNMTQLARRLSAYPNIIIRAGKAIFAHQQGLSYAFAELDGASGTMTPLTPVRSVFSEINALWTGPSGAVCFLRTNHDASAWEIGSMNPAAPDDAITTSISMPASTGPLMPRVEHACVVDTKLFFSLTENEGRVLSVYCTDGTASETTRIYQRTGSTPARLELMSALGRAFFNVVSDGPSLLHSSDGTLAGTRFLGSPGFLMLHANGSTAVSSSELYLMPLSTATVFATDGVTTRTLPPPEAAGPFLSATDALAWIGEHLYIELHSSSEIRQYVTDGYTTPTILSSANNPAGLIKGVKSVTSGTLLRSEDGVFFTTGELASAQLLATIDTSIPEHRVLDIFQGHAVYNKVAAAGSSGEQLFLSRSNPGSPVAITNFQQIPLSSDPGNYIKAGGKLFFTDGMAQQELQFNDRSTYCLDPIEQTVTKAAPFGVNWIGTTPIGPLYSPYFGPGSSGDVYVINAAVPSGVKIRLTSDGSGFRRSAPLFNLGDVCYFTISAPGVSPVLYRSNGIPSGTQIIIHHPGPGTLLEGPYQPIGVAGTHGYFYAKTATPTPSLYPVWAVAGPISAITPIASFPQPPTPGAALPGSRIIFAASPAESGPYTIYTCSGTAASLTALGTAGAERPSHFVSAGTNVYYYSAAAAPGGGLPFSEAVMQLSYTDGASHTGPVDATGGIRLIQNARLQLRSSAHGGVYCVGTTPDGHSQIAYSDGTSAGTRILAELPAAAAPQLLEEVNGWMYMAVTTPDLGRELYRATATAGSIQLVQDLAPGAASGAVMQDAAVLGNTLYFAGYDNGLSSTGRELYGLTVLDSSVSDWTLY